MDNTQIIDTKEIALTGGITRAEITEMVKQFKTLTIIPDDKKSFETVNSARMDFVHLRTSIEKNRLDQNAADKATIQGKIDSRNALAKEITKIFAPAETHLTEEVDREKARLKKIEDDKVQAEMDRVNKIRAQIQKIKEYAFVSISLASCEIQEKWEVAQNLMSFDWQEFQDEANAEIEKTRIALITALEERTKWEEDQVKAKAEADRLAQVAAEQKAAQEKIDADNKRLADAQTALKAEQDRMEREAREAKIYEDARQKALKEAQEKVDKEKQDKADAEARASKEAEEKKKADDAEAARLLALKPDAEKIREWAKVLIAIEGPAVADKKFQEEIRLAQGKIFGIVKTLLKLVEAL